MKRARPPAPLTADELHGLGLPRCPRARTAPLRRLEWLALPPAQGITPTLTPAEQRQGSCMVTVCSSDYLHYARVLTRSFREHHPGVAVFVVVSDGDARSQTVKGATVLGGSTVAGGELDYLALKYGAAELCCALKPFALSYLLQHTRFAQILYLDSDILVFEPLRKLFEGLHQHDFVATPHTFAPTPNPERFSWERPQLGHLACGGVLNAGMFALRCGAEAQRFLDTWRLLTSRPGAFLIAGESEQQSFNWITSFAADVEILRDPAYNVAYWNLHERSLRHRLLDDPAADREWTVNGEPLVAFHFSGFSLTDPSHLSRYDSRHQLYPSPSLNQLVAYYLHELREQGADDPPVEYGFARFPSGIPIDDRMRLVFRRYESLLRPPISPWTPEGESLCASALLSPVLATGSLTPVLFHGIYLERADLQKTIPLAHEKPETLWRWIAGHGIHEYGYRELFDRHRPVLPTLTGATHLAEVRDEAPGVLADLTAPLGADRHFFLDRLRRAGYEQLADELRGGGEEIYFVGCISAIRQVLDERPDVRRAFPDPLDADAAGFARWLARDGVRDHYLPEPAGEVFARCAEGRSLARLYSDLVQRPDWMAALPLALVGEGRGELLQRYLQLAGNHGVAVDIEDLLTYLWTMDERPWAGLGLTLELLTNIERTPSSLLPEGQEALLAPLLARDHRFRVALESYRHEHRQPAHLDEERLIRERPAPTRSPSAHMLVGLESSPPVARRSARGQATAVGSRGGRPGVNLYGYHKSPTGLGTLTEGLRSALACVGLPVRNSVFGCDSMTTDTGPADFVRSWDATLDTNVVISYPHLERILLDTLPEHRVRGRHNVAYLAWEQRDGNPLWERVYETCDQVWALSDFAASCFRRFMRREVLTVPCVVDTGTLPPAATKRAVGLSPGLFTFLYAFDISSSIERKNPEAAVRAFVHAFAAEDRVQLVLRVSNWHRVDYRQRLERLLQVIPRHLDVKLLVGDLPRAQLLRLISAADCYVSLHRAEGFGFTCAEAMAYRRPVIATGYSGNLQFMNGENSFLVGSTEVEVDVADGPFQRGSVWAEPDVAHAAHLMRQVFLDRSGAAAVAERGRADVLALLSPSVVGLVVAGALGVPVAEPGVTPLTRIGESRALIP